MEFVYYTDTPIYIPISNPKNLSDIWDAFSRTLKKVIDSSIIQVGIKKRAKKIFDNTSDTFQRRKIDEFFVELDKEFEAKVHENNCVLGKRRDDDYDEERTIKRQYQVGNTMLPPPIFIESE
nr:11077_t:CDS:2 [Entrophospora candida]